MTYMASIFIVMKVGSATLTTTIKIVKEIAVVKVTISFSLITLLPMIVELSIAFAVVVVVTMLMITVVNFMRDHVDDDDDHNEDDGFNVFNQLR